MDKILDVPAHFYENELKSVKMYDTATSQTEGIWSLPNPPFKTRPLVSTGRLHPLSCKLIQRGSIFSLPTLYTAH